MSRVAGVTSNTVPWEILRAAGFAPRLLEDQPGPTPHADRLMEDVFDRRMRLIFDRLCSGDWGDLALVVLPRTSEQEHKLYLYLREAARAQFAAAMPPLYLYNLLHTRTQDAYSYGLERTREMALELGAAEGALGEAIAESNRARASVREILRKRQGGLLEGSSAIELIRGFYTVDRGDFANQTSAALGRYNTDVAANRPRILIKGVSGADGALHRVVEAAGGYVIAEDDFLGSRAAGHSDVALDMDPITAIFEKYFYDEVSPRVHPAEVRDEWFHRELESGYVDGVLFCLPLDDDVAGWDYPRHRAHLESRGIPSLVIREINAPLAEFVGSVPRR